MKYFPTHRRYYKRNDKNNNNNYYNNSEGSLISRRINGGKNGTEKSDIEKSRPFFT